jgi:hypothetical protein
MTGPERRITGFHRDTEGHWVGELECGHDQHVRHEPPLITRRWVLEEESRRAHLGTTLRCRLCEATPADSPILTLASLSPEARAAYDDALLRGLCHEGALEVARSRAHLPPPR